MSNDILNTENATVQKAVRFKPAHWERIEACMRQQGIKDYAAFAHMASVALIQRFERERVLTQPQTTEDVA